MNFKKRIRKIIEKITFKSKIYWEKRYQKGYNSGVGSYGKYSEYKGEFLNDFIEKNNIQSIVDFGCGDGNQASHLKINKYLGIDISKSAIKICKNKFEEDPNKAFYVYYKFRKIASVVNNFNADLAISMDVIFHLIEEKIFNTYINDLFKMSSKYVIIYSTNFSQKHDSIHHVDRKFSEYIDENINNWKLIKCFKNPLKDVNTMSDFYIYKKGE